jgi:lysophospholipase L1-like esterase
LLLLPLEPDHRQVDQQISPFRVLAFTFSVLSGFVIIMANYPKDGITITDSIHLKFPTLQAFLFNRKKEAPKVDDILRNIDTTMLVEEPVDTFLRHNNASGSELGAPNDTSDIAVDAAKIRRLEFGTNGASILYPIFDKLGSAAANKKIVRIIHYGDSQIEGDRMTGYIRQKLQGRFGGNGPGMVPAYNQYHTLSFVQTLSSNFKRHAVFGEVSKSVKHKKYGSMGSFARFTKIVEDSLIVNNEVAEGWIEIGFHKQAYSNARSFNRIRLFYGNCKTHCDLQVFNNGELIHEDTLNPDGEYHVIDLMFDQTPEKLKYVFKTKDSPDFYGFSLDGNYGIAVDNVAMRGGSGTFLGRTDYNLMSRMYGDLGVEMFIMQFGGNTMPYLKDEASARGYASQFQSNLNTLRKLRPGAVIIVIGPSDMSTKINGEYQTYPLLATLVAEMKQAAFKANAAYWDMYSAMGGENSMIAWVEKDLAGPDYTHFTPGGARYVAEMFYEAFIYEYQQYTKTKGQ